MDQKITMLRVHWTPSSATCDLNVPAMLFRSDTDSTLCPTEMCNGGQTCDDGVEVDQVGGQHADVRHIPGIDVLGDLERIRNVFPWAGGHLHPYLDVFHPLLSEVKREELDVSLIYQSHLYDSLSDTGLGQGVGKESLNNEEVAVLGQLGAEYLQAHLLRSVALLHMPQKYAILEQRVLVEHRRFPVPRQ